MSERIVGLYIFLLRTVGAYAAAFSVLFFATLNTQNASGIDLILPVLGNLLALAIAIAIAIPPIKAERLTPKAREGEFFSLIVPLAALPFLMVLPSWTAVAGLGLGTELTRNMAILSSAPTLLLAGLAWVIAFALHMRAKAKAGVSGQPDTTALAAG
ncbi:hypothetical protein [Thalassococcus lentus]|uniref:Uncharacterized protein n=1 Tax=Thalassococcus lentus TaxID=1210524 RepID=A0ABT4XXU7_9RHOB|nr:hypothetical protein [Thalassococcus lentus]MDA7426799.1 hypothetical protein [Thalassococcus lentus]